MNTVKGSQLGLKGSQLGWTTEGKNAPTSVLLKTTEESGVGAVWAGAPAPRLHGLGGRSWDPRSDVKTAPQREGGDGLRMLSDALGADDPRAPERLHAWHLSPRDGTSVVRRTRDNSRHLKKDGDTQ